jgi:hypothetical protein
MITVGKTNIVWGCQPDFLNAEILNLPKDVLKVRRNQRPKREMVLFLKFKDRIEKWIPETEGDKLKLWLFKGANKTD